MEKWLEHDPEKTEMIVGTHDSALERLERQLAKISRRPEFYARAVKNGIEVLYDNPASGERSDIAVAVTADGLKRLEKQLDAWIQEVDEISAVDEDFLRVAGMVGSDGIQFKFDGELLIVSFRHTEYSFMRDFNGLTSLIGFLADAELFDEKIMNEAACVFA